MKKLILLLFVSVLLFASAVDTERKIYSTVLKAIFPHKSVVRLYVDEPERKKVFEKIPFVEMVDDIKKAEIAIISKTKRLECNCIVFTTNYKMLKLLKNKAIGGFFWQKGRPNIIFLRGNLKKEHIDLPSSFQGYVEDEL